jgi:hypothetical protein
MKLRAVSALALALFFPLSALAEPLVKLEGDKPTPGVVTAWSAAGNKVELTVREGTDPKTVADAIQAGVEKVKARVQAGKVVVTGRAEADLLKALATVDLGGDLGALAMAEGDDSGSSLRAKKSEDLAKIFADQKSTAIGSVVSVTQGTFPDVTVVVQVVRGPTGPEGAKVKKGARITFRPTFKRAANGKLDIDDADNQTNLSAWSLRARDQVRVKLGKETKDGFEAALIDRN